MSPEALAQKLEKIEADVAELKALIGLHVKLGFKTHEAAFLTSIGEAELRKRALSPESSPLHIKTLPVGGKRPKRVFPRSELERLLREGAR